MALTSIWGSRCPGKEGGSRSRANAHISESRCGAPELLLDRQEAARFYVLADEVYGGFKRRSRPEDGRDTVFF
jgi:hypothetical protein